MRLDIEKPVESIHTRGMIPRDKSPMRMQARRTSSRWALSSPRTDVSAASPAATERDPSLVLVDRGRKTVERRGVVARTRVGHGTSERAPRERPAESGENTASPKACNPARRHWLANRARANSERPSSRRTSSTTCSPILSPRRRRRFLVIFSSLSSQARGAP